MDILVLEYTKQKHTLRISYTIVLPRRHVPAVRIGLMCSSIITVKQHQQIGNNTALLSVQELGSLSVLIYVVTVSVLFPSVLQVMTSN